MAAVNSNSVDLFSLLKISFPISLAVPKTNQKCCKTHEFTDSPVVAVAPFTTVKLDDKSKSDISNT